jgi:hypothetical protein
LCAERLLEIFCEGGKLLKQESSVPPDVSSLKRIHVAKAFHSDALVEVLR